MNSEKGKYLICIIRNNGDFYKYHLTDDVDEAAKTYIKWRDNKSLIDIHIIIAKRLVTTVGIVNNTDRPHLFLIDLTASDSDVIENTLESQSLLRKFKRIKRLYKLKYLFT